MTFGSVEEILDMAGRMRDRLHRHVVGLSEAQESYRAASGEWTIAEIVEHLANVQEGMGKVTSKLLNEAESAGAHASSDGKIGPVSALFVTERVDEKFQAPEHVRPHGGVKVTDSLARLNAHYERLMGMRPRIEAADIGAVTFPHPAFGTLTGYQWLALMGIHQGRHIAQIERIKAADGYPR